MINKFKEMNGTIRLKNNLFFKINFLELLAIMYYKNNDNNNKY